jgi:hypothetical protein
MLICFIYVIHDFKWVNTVRPHVMLPVALCLLLPSNPLLLNDDDHLFLRLSDTLSSVR